MSQTLPLNRTGLDFAHPGEFVQSLTIMRGSPVTFWNQLDL